MHLAWELPIWVSGLCIHVGQRDGSVRTGYLDCAGQRDGSVRTGYLDCVGQRDGSVRTIEKCFIASDYSVRL